jgi:hypothetical protein
MIRDKRSDDHDRDFRDDDFRDDDFRVRFAALRKEEEAQAPEFAVPAWSGAGARRWRSAEKVLVMAVCLVTIVAALVLVRFGPPKPGRNGAPVASITEWRAPTDFLLQTSGQEFLRTVPAIGVWRDYTEARKAEQKHLQVKKQGLH